MADHHQHNRPRTIRRAWLESMVGTPRRFLITVSVAIVILYIAVPQVMDPLITSVVVQLASVLGPVVYGLLPIAIAILAIWMIFGAMRPRRRNQHRDRH